jgi:hypothetical protein
MQEGRRRGELLGGSLPRVLLQPQAELRMCAELLQHGHHLLGQLHSSQPLCSGVDRHHDKQDGGMPTCMYAPPPCLHTTTRIAEQLAVRSSIIICCICGLSIASHRVAPASGQGPQHMCVILAYMAPPHTYGTTSQSALPLTVASLPTYPSRLLQAAVRICIVQCAPTLTYKFCMLHLYLPDHSGMLHPAAPPPSPKPLALPPIKCAKGDFGVACLLNPCRVSTCEAQPNYVCVPNYCTKATTYLGNFIPASPCSAVWIDTTTNKTVPCTAPVGACRPLARLLQLCGAGCSHIRL